MSTDLQKQVLLFTTGSDRIPVGGVAEMTFKITRVDNINMSVSRSVSHSFKQTNGRSFYLLSATKEVTKTFEAT